MKGKYWAALGIAGLAVTGAMLRERWSEDDLEGQTVLITGGSRGLGLLLARECALEGCNIVICARDEDELAYARAELAEFASAVLAVPCDVTQPRELNHLVDVATARFGGIDILINNAGIVQVGPQQALTVQDFEDAMAVIFWGVLFPTLAVLPQMRARHYGRIVNITSIGGKVSVPHMLPYCSAKFAAVGLSEGLRAELASEGIRVTTIAPGLMRTGSYYNARFKGQETDEFTWFALGSSLPVLSMNAERAAAQIVTSIKRGEAERILTIPANLLARFHGLFPGITADLLGMTANLLLPRAEYSDPVAVPGEVVSARLPEPRRQVMDVLTTLGRHAAQRYQAKPAVRL